MPNWTLLRLKEKAKGNISEALFRRIEAGNAADHRGAETIQDFLARGGKITKITPQKERR